MVGFEEPAVADYPPGNDPPKKLAGQEKKRIRAPAFHGSLGMHIRLAPLGSDFDSYSNSRRHLLRQPQLLGRIVTNSIFYDADLVSARLKPSSATVCAMNIVIGVQVVVRMSDSIALTFLALSSIPIAP